MPPEVTEPEAKAGLEKLVARAKEHDEQFTITVDGTPAAVLVSFDHWDSLMETLDVLGNPETMRQLAESKRDKAAGRMYRITPGMTLEQFRNLPDLP